MIIISNFAATSVFADETSQIDESELRDFYKSIRCPVCGGQSIYDSNSGQAIEMRKQILTKLQSGSSYNEVKNQLVEEYGDAALMTNPGRRTLELFWFLPFLCTMIIISVILLKNKNAS